MHVHHRDKSVIHSQSQSQSRLASSLLYDMSNHCEFISGTRLETWKAPAKSPNLQECRIASGKYIPYLSVCVCIRPGVVRDEAALEITIHLIHAWSKFESVSSSSDEMGIRQNKQSQFAFLRTTLDLEIQCPYQSSLLLSCSWFNSILIAQLTMSLIRVILTLQPLTFMDDEGLVRLKWCENSAKDQVRGLFIRRKVHDWRRREMAMLKQARPDALFASLFFKKSLDWLK